jgi:hypothetical protein
MAHWPFPPMSIHAVSDGHTAPSTKAHHLRDGEPCGHRGCLSHVSRPCEGCGRIAGALLPAPIVDGEPQEIECTDMSDLDVCIPVGDE